MGGGAHAPEAKHDGTETTAFGKYQLFASLGRGGMADVFLSVARGQMGFNKLAVIKRLRQALAEEVAFRNMFLDEARLAARLSHPNIVHTYEVGEQNGAFFIAMEYLEGQSLNKVLKEAARRKEMIEPEVAVRIIADALAGLGYAHELRDYDGRPLSIIHRDVSPHNIFVTYDGHTKLVDFGIAKAALSSTETEVGILKGKVAYMSPEQATGQRIDARSDLFPVGIVLWELIARQRLMAGESAANTLHKLMNEPIPRLSAVIPHIDPALDMLVARALEKDPNIRWQSAAEMRDALESWLTAQPHRARQEDVSHRMVSLFGDVREEVQRQIQKHMAALTSSDVRAPHALTIASLERLEQSGENMSGQLLRLGTGSGAIESYGGLSSQASGSAGLHAASQPKSSSSALLVAITVGCFVLAGILIVVLGFRDRRTDPALTDPTASPEGLGEAPADSTPPLFPDPPPPPPSIISLPTTTAPTAIPPVTPPSTATTAPPVKTHAHNTPPPPKTAVAPPKTAPAPPPPPPADEPGFLTISSYPWAKVTEGSKVICPVTPCNKVQMSAGTHALTFENGEQPGQKQTVSVQVKSGETATKNVGFKRE